MDRTASMGAPGRPCDNLELGGWEESGARGIIMQRVAAISGELTCVGGMPLRFLPAQNFGPFVDPGLASTVGMRSPRRHGRPRSTA